MDFSATEVPQRLRQLLGQEDQDGRLWHADGACAAVVCTARQRQTGSIMSDRARNRLVAWAGNNWQQEPGLSAVLETGIEAVGQLEPGIAVCRWDGDRRELWLATDRYGNSPLYYRWDGSLLVFGSEAKSVLCLLGERAQLDRQVLGEVLWFGHTVSEGTLFEGVFRLGPGTRVRFSAQGKTEEQYWSLRFRAGGQDALDAAEEALHQAVANATRDAGVAMGLSGGMDSRAILAEVVGLKRPVAGFTAGVEDSADMKVARRLARHLRGEHHRYVVGRGLFRELAQLNQDLVWLTDGALGLENSHLIRMNRECAGRFAALIDGGGAEVCKRSFLRRRAKAVESKSALPRLVARAYGNPGVVQALLGPAGFAEVEERVLTLLGQRLREVEHDTVGDTLDALFIRVNWPCFYAHAFALQAGFLEGRLPFLDYRFVDLMREVPQEQRARDGIHLRAVERRAPELRRHGRVFGGVVVPFSDAGLLKYPMPALSRLVRKLGLRGFDRQAFPYFEWFKAGLLPDAGAAAARLAERRVLDPDRLRAATSAAETPAQTRFQASLLVLRLELWHELFCDALPVG